MSWYNMSALMLLIFATSVAAYSETPAIFEEGNSLNYEMNSWPLAFEDKIENDMYWGRNLILYKLLKHLQGDGDRYNMRDNLNIEQKLSPLPDLKDADEKKWVTALSNIGKSTKTPKPPPQPKQKSKQSKGLLLCYLKLCSIRTRFY